MKLINQCMRKEAKQILQLLHPSAWSVQVEEKCTRTISLQATFKWKQLIVELISGTGVQVFKLVSYQVCQEDITIYVCNMVENQTHIVPSLSEWFGRLRSIPFEKILGILRIEKHVLNSTLQLLQPLMQCGTLSLKAILKYFNVPKQCF